MNLTIFCTAFILQFVGHRVGDYLFQTDWQAQNKANDGVARVRHCVVYSLTVAAFILLAFDWRLAVVVFGLTFFEHFWIDSRKPIIAWKSFLENKIARQQNFDINNMPFFVLIEMDQTVHLLRIFVISVLLGYGILYVK